MAQIFTQIHHKIMQLVVISNKLKHSEFQQVIVIAAVSVRNYPMIILLNHMNRIEKGKTGTNVLKRRRKTNSTKKAYIRMANSFPTLTQHQVMVTSKPTKKERKIITKKKNR